MYKKIIKKLFHELGIYLLLMLLLVGAAFSWCVFTNSGRNLLVSVIGPFAARIAGYELVIEEVNYPRLENVKIGNLSIKKSGVFLVKVRNADINFYPKKLLQGILEITAITADSIEIDPLFNKGEKLKLTKVNGGLAVSDKLFICNQLNINLDGGLLDCNGYLNFEKETAELAIVVKSVSDRFLSFLNQKPNQGTFNGAMKIVGNPYVPKIDGNLNYTGVSFKNNPKLNIAMQVTSTKQKSDVAVTITDFAKKIIIGKASIAFPISFYDSIIKQKSNVGLDLTVSTDMELSNLQFLISQTQQVIKGRLKTDLVVLGSLVDPKVNGKIYLNNGYYENLQSGTVIKEINAEILAENRILVVKNATAKDRVGKGSFILNGNVFLDPKDYKINLNLNIKNAKLLKRDDLDGVAGGLLILNGNANSMRISGAVEIDDLEILLDSLLKKDVAELKVTEIYDLNELKQNENERQSVKLLQNLDIDVSLKTNRKAYLRGKGVEAELQGDIKIDGNLSQPHYSGNFKTIRGSYEILGKKFTLTSGIVQFEGKDYIFDITGVNHTKNLDVKAQLFGSADNLKVNLTSTPSLPQDEIVSQLLFGKSAQSISPFQAVKLANAIAQLQNGGRAIFDPLDKVKKLVGVDTLSVDSEESANGNGQDVTVGVGKYLSEKVYLEIDRSNDPTKPWQGKVNIELMPNLNLESSTGGDSGLGGVELQYKHDY